VLTFIIDNCAAELLFHNRVLSLKCRIRFYGSAELDMSANEKMRSGCQLRVNSLSSRYRKLQRQDQFECGKRML